MSRALSVVALIAAYNEADVIEQVVRDLIANGVSVYLVDDGSTDDTARLVEPLVGRGVVAIERLAPPPGGADAHKFAWERLLRRKSQLAADLDADWFIHHDADEFRESPWAGVSLQDAIRRVDALGYNAIDFVDLDFWPTHDGFDAGTDVRAAFPWYSDAASYDRVQIRCWKKAPHVDLASSGGHDVKFENRRVFPIRFISRHYPIRGQAHGERKVFAERRPRFSSGERARKWHVQYDGVQEGTSFIRDVCDLTRYDGDAVRMTLALRHRGVEALEASVAESKATLDAVQHALDKARCETQSARDEIARHSGHTAALTGTLERLNREVESHREEGRQLRAAAEARAIEIGETRAQLAQLREVVDVRDGELREARRQTGQLRDALEEQRVVLDDERAQAAVRDRLLNARVKEIGDFGHALADVRGRLDAVHRSWSWRVMTPARVLLRWLRGY
jgi:glycosyltransferase involved in cell wall biosynthesis